MQKQPNEKIPVFRSWIQWYLAVLAFNALLVLLFKLFTRFFA